MTENIPYYKTEAGKTAQRQYQKKYRATEKGKASYKQSCDKYRKTDNGRRSILESNRRYRTITAKGRLVRYNNRKQYYDKTKHLSTGRRKWTLEEEEILMNFTGTDEELAYELGRSVSAIQNHRYTIKRREVVIQ